MSIKYRIPMWTMLAIMFMAFTAQARTDEPLRPWQFQKRLPPIVLGSWLPPNATRSEFKRYADAGFNTVFLFDSRKIRVEDFALAEEFHLSVIINNMWWWANKSFPAVDEIIKQWGDQKNLAGIWIADDCENPGEAQRTMTKTINRMRPDLLPLICQDRPNGVGLAAIGNPVEWDMVYSFKDPLREIGRLVKQSHENGLIPWVIVNIEFRPGTGDFDWVRKTMLEAKSKDIRGFWYFTADPNFYDGKHDLSAIAELNRTLAVVR